MAQVFRGLRCLLREDVFELVDCNPVRQAAEETQKPPRTRGYV